MKILISVIQIHNYEESSFYCRRDFSQRSKLPPAGWTAISTNEVGIDSFLLKFGEDFLNFSTTIRGVKRAW